MKNIRIQIDDTLHSRLTALCTHHGQLSHLIRQGIRLIVITKEKELELIKKETNNDNT